MTDQIKENFNSFETQLNGESKLAWHLLRKEAYNAFESMGFPEPGDEEYKYTHVERLFEKNVHFAIPKTETIKQQVAIPTAFHEEEAIHVVIVDGEVTLISGSAAAEQGIVVLTLREALKSYPDELNAHFGKYADVNKDPFTAINTAFSYEGVFIQIPKKKKVEKPIILHYHFRDQKEGSVQTRNLILVGQGAEVNITESYSTTSSQAFYGNHVSEIAVEANAHLNYFKLQNQGGLTCQIDNTFIHQKRDSVVRTFTFTLEGKLIRNNLNIALDEENSSSHMYGLYVAQGSGHIDNHTVVDHRVPNCYSNEIYKGILDDHSKGVFNGKIFVRQDAQKTNAFQSNKNILLTDTASINTKPQLEIWADDVKCSHGCTTGQLDDKQMFYLRSRGIAASTARAMLLHAFANDVIDKIEIDFLREFINSEMYKRLD
jgi:Fe-S cluster assembly protein SufD